MVNVHPQTEIEIIAKYSCLMQSYIYCAGIPPDTKKYFEICLEAIRAGEDKSGCAGDCTVNNAERFLYWLTGKKYNVLKKVCSSIKDIKEPTLVRYYAPGYTPHFVVVQKGEIIFDPLLNSFSVTEGKPQDARFISLVR